MYLITDNTWLFADVFQNFRKMRLKIYHLDPVSFFSAPGLAWQAALKKKKVKLESLADIDMLFMVEKKETEDVMQFTSMEKLITNIWKIR